MKVRSKPTPSSWALAPWACSRCSSWACWRSRPTSLTHWPTPVASRWSCTPTSRSTTFPPFRCARAKNSPTPCSNRFSPSARPFTWGKRSPRYKSKTTGVSSSRPPKARSSSPKPSSSPQAWGLFSRARSRWKAWTSLMARRCFTGSRTRRTLRARTSSLPVVVIPHSIGR